MKQLDQFILTIGNCYELKSLRHFRMLYNECDVPIIRTKLLEEACIVWQTNNNRYEKTRYIKIGQFESDMILDTALMHEIGHDIDYKRKARYFNYISQNDNCEKAAWKEAIGLSKKYNLNMCYDSAIQWLSTYGLKYRVLENLSSNKA